MLSSFLSWVIKTVTVPTNLSLISQGYGKARAYCACNRLAGFSFSPLVYPIFFSASDINEFDFKSQNLCQTNKP